MNPDNHTGETETGNAKDATEFEDGYTGDTYCKDCGTLLEEGETIPATHKHSFSENWKYDSDNHWYECDCGEKDSLAGHTNSDGKCTTCGMEAPEDDNNPNEGIDLDEILGLLPEIDLDGILSVLPEIDLESILGLIPGFGNDDNPTPETDKKADAEIPDTGSDYSVIIVFVMLSVSIITVSAVNFRRKKKASHK